MNLNKIYLNKGIWWFGEWGGLHVVDTFHGADDGILQMGQLWSARWESGARLVWPQLWS